MSEDQGSLQVKSPIKWPQGKHPTQVRNKVRKLRKLILEGTVLAVDPASGSTSHPGWALFRKGELIDKGIIELNSKEPIQTRLRDLFYALDSINMSGDIDVLIIEEIRGSMAHAYLFWACGVIAAALGTLQLIEEPVSFWKAVIPDGYVKDDAMDAAYLGIAIILLAKELDNE